MNMPSSLNYRAALRWLGVASAAAVLAACGGGGGGGTASGDGTLRVAMTDAPSCGYDHVYVTVEKVRVHTSSTAGDSDAGWSELTLSPARRVDLLTLTNGVLEEMGSMPLPAGRYTQVRLVLGSNSGGATPANAVQPTGGSLTPLDTPSGQQTGLKLNANIDVAAGQMADLVLDFDACKSVVKAGNSGKFLLKPVIAVVPRIGAGIQGYVATTMPLANTVVAAQQNGVTVRSTVPDAGGQFTLPFLAAGSYDVVVTAEGRSTAVVTSVPVGTVSAVINGTATAIATPMSSMADVTGTVVVSTLSGTTTVATPVTDGLVRALQALTGGPTVEVVAKPVDATLGSYHLRLPVAAPVRAPYVAGGTLTFTSDLPVAGKYTLEASAPGRTPQAKPADVSGGIGATVNFTYGP